MSWLQLCLFLCLHSTLESDKATSPAQPAVEHSSSSETQKLMPWQIYFAGGLLPDLSGLALKVGLYQKRINHSQDDYWRWGAGIFGSRYLKSEIYLSRAWSQYFKTRLQYETWFWPALFKGRGIGLAFETSTEPFDMNTLESRSGEEELAFGHALRIRPTWLYETKRWAFVNELNLRGWLIPGKRSYWYDVSYHTLIRRGEPDFTLNNTPWVFYKVWQEKQTNQRLWLGLLHQFTWAYSTNIARHRIGGAFIFRPLETLWGFPGITIFGIGGINLVERHRQGKLWGAMLILREFEF